MFNLRKRIGSKTSTARTKRQTHRIGRQLDWLENRIAPAIYDILFDNVNAQFTGHIYNHTDPAYPGTFYRIDGEVRNITTGQVLYTYSDQIEPQYTSLRFLGSNSTDIVINDTSLSLLANAKGGNDKIIGGSGNDTIAGGQGNDLLIGQAGDDEITGDEGADTIYAGSGTDNIGPSDGSDVFRATDDPVINFSSTSVVEGPNGVTSPALFIATMEFKTSGNTYVEFPNWQAVSVAYKTVDGTAEADLDYFSSEQFAMFAVGQTKVTAVVQIKGDDLVESDEYYWIVNNGPTHNVTFGTMGRINILDDEPHMFVVTNSADDGVGSEFRGDFRYCVNRANFTATTDTITFDAQIFSTPQAISLTQGAFAINTPMAINGPGSGLLSLDGTGIDRIFMITAPSNVSIEVSGFALNGGRTIGSGGAIWNSASLKLTGCALKQNSASVEGGAIFSNGFLTASNCQFDENTAATNGGALAIGASTVTLSTFTSNSAGGSGGAIQGTATGSIGSCNFTHNVAGVNGGAIATGSVGQSMTNCRFISNEASGSGGAIISESSFLSPYRCEFDKNLSGAFGGAVAQIASLPNSNLGFSYVLFSENRSIRDGGAVFVNSGRKVTFLNCTVSGTLTNSANLQGVSDAAIAIGGNWVEGLYIQNSTIANNTTNNFNLNGGAVARIGNSGDIYLESSVITQNPNLLSVKSAGSVKIKNCAISSLTGTGTYVDQGGNLVGVDCKLGPLTDNGGPTRTHALLPNSPCIDTGSNPKGTAGDQRFSPRSCRFLTDMGAYEFATPPRIRVVVNDGAVQRSMVKTIRVVFDQVLVFDDSYYNQLTLRRIGPGGVIDPVDISVYYPIPFSQTELVLGFNGSLSENGSLVDGRYELVVLSANIHGLTTGQLDGNGDGIGGDDYVSPDRAIFRLFGDATGDGSVSNSDYIAFRMNFGGGNSIFDFDGDGSVSNSDFTQFRMRFGGSI